MRTDQNYTTRERTRPESPLHAAAFIDPSAVDEAIAAATAKSPSHRQRTARRIDRSSVESNNGAIAASSDDHSVSQQNDSVEDNLFGAIGDQLLALQQQQRQLQRLLAATID